MAYRFIFLACLQVLCLQDANSQAINFPKCGCQSQLTVTETYQQPLINQPCQQIISQPCGCQQVVTQPCGCQQVVTKPCGCQQVVTQTCGCQPVVTQSCGCQQVTTQTCGCQPVVSQTTYAPAVQCAVPAATIIQDDTIANDLANTLQLLIVSNLLNNNLPGNGILNLGAFGSIGQPALLGQGLGFGSPLLQVANPCLPVVGCGCGCGCGLCGCGCGGCSYIC